MRTFQWYSTREFFFCRWKWWLLSAAWRWLRWWYGGAANEQTVRCENLIIRVSHDSLSDVTGSFATLNETSVHELCAKLKQVFTSEKFTQHTECTLLPCIVVNFPHQIPLSNYCNTKFEFTPVQQSWACWRASTQQFTSHLCLSSRFQRPNSPWLSYSSRQKNSFLVPESCQVTGKTIKMLWTISSGSNKSSMEFTSWKFPELTISLIRQKLSS